MITIFRNIKETSTPFFRDVSFVFDRIKTGKYRDLIEQIRFEEDKTRRGELKKNLPAICFSGKFNKRADDAIIEHSGLICLDFDGYENQKEMNDEKASMSKDKYVMAAFVSPSGNGLKVVIKINKDPENHKRYFEALQSHFDSKYFDTTSKNISRVCYESYDPEMYINMDSEVWTTMAEVESKPIEMKNIISTVPITDESRIVDRLMKWWTRDFGLIDGERNNNVFVLAAAFNDFGVSKSFAEYIIGQMQSSDFTMREIKTTIDSAYKNTAAHGSKFYEDDEELHRIRTKINRGASSREIKKDLRNLDMNDESIEEVIMNMEKDSSVKKFWHKSDKGSVSIIHFLFKEFLELNGFYKFSGVGKKRHTFVRVSNNLINNSNEEEIKDFVLTYLMGIDDLSIYNHFADKTRYFKDDFLFMLDTVKIHFIEDDKSSSYIYYRNCALKITKDKVEPIDYVDLEGYVWKDQVIDRDFDFCDDTSCDFRTFVYNLSGKDEKRTASIQSTIGYLLSSYKDPRYCPAVVLNDEVIIDTPEGGTGKGLFVQAIGKLKNTISLDGKKFNFSDQFAYQTISRDTQIVSFDDVKKNFDFEKLFSVITEGIKLEEKYEKAVSIPFKDAPKIVITTNYAIKGKGNSFARRKWELEFAQHYKLNYTPADEFGRRFFDDWDEDEWCRFDNYMINNLKSYLGTGLVYSESKNLNLRRLIADTAPEFIEWLGLISDGKEDSLLKFNKRIIKDDLYVDFVSDNPDFAPRAKNTVSRIEFYKWLKYYAQYVGDIIVQEGRDRIGRWIIFKTKDFNERGERTLEF